MRTDGGWGGGQRDFIRVYSVTFSFLFFEKPEQPSGMRRALALLALTQKPEERREMYIRARGSVNTSDLGCYHLPCQQRLLVLCVLQARHLLQVSLQSLGEILSDRKVDLLQRIQAVLLVLHRRKVRFDPIWLAREVRHRDVIAVP